MPWTKLITLLLDCLYNTLFEIPTEHVGISNN